MVSRCLGKISNWPKILESQAKLGYNAIHLVPIQRYGISGSMYSIRDQLSVDDLYFDEPNKLPPEKRLEMVKNVIDDIREKYDTLFFVDIVLNHTAINSDWLLDHPDGAYNLVNCPYLTVAYKLDKFLAEFSEAYLQRKINECPYAPYIGNENDLRSVMSALSNRIRGIPLDQYFYYDKGKVKAKFDEFMKYAENFMSNPIQTAYVDLFDYAQKHSFGYGERQYGVDMEVDKVALVIISKIKNKNAQSIWNELNGLMDRGNGVWRGKYEGFINEALKNIEDTIRDEKINCRNTKVSQQNPLVRRYFAELKNNHPEKNPNEFIVAFNGWTMITEDFGSKYSFHYLRRAIHIWDDCVKLYYGRKIEDSPYIWGHMEKYLGAMATIFQGMRVDNCHSTPLHVLEYFVNYARTINPSLFVFAELFSGSIFTDSLYTKRIGLNALIREAIHCRETVHLAETIRNTGGDREHPIDGVDKEIMLPDSRKLRVLHSSKPKSLLYDVTHDNPSAVDAWNPQAILPAICALSMAHEPIGTTHGVDEFYPKNLSVVSERRPYKILQESDMPDLEKEEGKEMQGKEVELTFIGDATKVSVVGSFNSWKNDSNMMDQVDKRTWKTKMNLMPGKYHYKFWVNGNWALGNGPTERDNLGLVNNVIVVEDRNIGSKFKVFDDLRGVRKILNNVHSKFGTHKTSLSTYNLDDVLIVKRLFEDVDPSEENAYVMITRTTFRKGWGIEPEGINKTITLPGKLSRVLFMCNMFCDPDKIWNFPQDPHFATGPKGQIYFHFDGSGLKYFARLRSDGEYDCLDFFKMPSSFSMLVTTKFSQRQQIITKNLMTIEDPPVFDLTMGSINYILFRCVPEEQDGAKKYRGIYEFKGIVPKYAGIASLMYEFNRANNNAEFYNPIFENIKDGNWLIDHILARISEKQELSKISGWLGKYLAPIKELKPVYRPQLFVTVISKLYHTIWADVLKKLPQEFREDIFTSMLALSTYQFVGDVPSNYFREIKDTIAAGLPHFSAGFMRCWGRDTMIALRGLLIIPQRFIEARKILIMFAAVMRHGLIPNLHDRGNNTRFNSRDSTWYFTEALQQYVKSDKQNGKTIFNENIEMQFLDPDLATHYKKVSTGQKSYMKFADIIQHIMQSHASGIDFVEWNAGPQIDSNMKQEGFNVKIRLDPATGFIHGGNKFNCGTWMDKMGSSDKAKNRGIPASPRDGADVEIIGLLRSCLRFLSEMREQEVFPYDGVLLADQSSLTYKKWAELIDSNFERHFWIPNDMADYSKYLVDSKLINSKGIYKDVFNSSDPYHEYMFRPNFLIAMAVAPEMFTPQHAQIALENVESGLFEKGSLGLKTLHPADKFYRPKYINNDDSNDFHMAHGFSYHMGPEWVWPMGYFIRSIMNFPNFESYYDFESYFL